jgi:hypothetical protein
MILLGSLLAAVVIGGVGFALGVAEGTRDTERRWSDAVSRAESQRQWDVSA